VARIYISATYGDLKEHRDRVYHALRQLGHDAIAMEDYVAADQRPLAKCLRTWPPATCTSGSSPTATATSPTTTTPSGARSPNWNTATPKPSVSPC
jgi:hypothetical protein